MRCYKAAHGTIMMRQVAMNKHGIFCTLYIRVYAVYLGTYSSSHQIRGKKTTDANTTATKPHTAGMKHSLTTSAFTSLVLTSEASVAWWGICFLGYHVRDNVGHKVCGHGLGCLERVPYEVRPLFAAIEQT